jgi:subtilase family serine protease
VDRMGDISSGGYAVYVGSECTIKNTTVRHSERDGIYVEDYNFSPVIQNNKFSNNPVSLSASPGGCGGITGNPNTKITVRGGSVTATTTWPVPGTNSKYELGGNITVESGKTLSIAPGVLVEFPTYDRGLYIRGTLLAKGTAADSVRFRGVANPDYNPNSTHGGTIWLYSGGAGSVLEYVSVDRMGDISSGGYAVYVGSECTIKNTTVRHSEQTGIYVENYNFSPSIQNNKFTYNPVAISAYPGMLGSVLSNSNAKIVIKAGSVESNVSWPFPGTNSYYVLEGQVYVREAYSLTVEPGVLVDFGVSGSLQVDGGLRAIGSEASPILFTNLESTPTSPVSGYIYFTPKSTNSIISQLQIKELGNVYGTPALEIATSDLAVSNLSVSNSKDIGFRYSASGSPVITSSNFFNNKTGVNVAQGRPVFSNCNIYGNTDYGINNVNSTVTDTVDARSCYWGTTTGPYHPSLNPSGTGNKVSDRVKFNPWQQQPQNGQVRDLGVIAILKPVTDCNFPATDSIQVRIRNFGNGSVSNFPVSYKVNNGAAVTETVPGPLTPGGSLDYTFTQKANLSVVGTYTIDAYTSLAADTIPGNNAAQAVIQHLPNVGAPTILLPSAGATNLDIPLLVNWASVSGATSYDLYVWKSTDAVPAQPLAANLTQISFNLSNSALQFNTQYRWKVVSKRASCQTESAVQIFTTRQVPDLVVESINVPPNVTSETDLVVSWRIKNQGAGATLSQGWTDLVYLCDQPTLAASSESYYITSRPNFSALSAGQSYQATNHTYRIPQGIQGRYYLIVTTNVARSLLESSFDNNERASSAIDIALAPPPDLQVTSLVVNPLNTFSEDSITITYTVKNAGTGPTTTTNWVDFILLSQSETLNLNTATYLDQYSRQQVLAVNGTYSNIKKIKLPGRISGTFYVHVVTDRYGQVYEYTNENNNSRSSLALNVIQRPTPNLMVSTPTVSATSLASNQPLSLQWTTSNPGALAAQPTWEEYIYLSADATFDGSDRMVGSLTRTAALPSLGEVSGQASVTIPGNQAEGNYYFFVKTDATDRIYENPDESDNVSAASPMIQVRNPDLRPTALSSVGTTAQSEQSIVLRWDVLNDSQVGVFNTNWTDQIYLSGNTTFEPGTDVLLSSIPANQLLAAGSGYSREASVTLPVGVSGAYNLLLIIDGGNTVFEKNEGNNIRTVPLSITLAPWPDLRVSSIQAPALDTVGTSIRVAYTTVNNGSGGIVNRSWRDYIYLSPSPTINESSLIYLGAVAQNRSLSNGQSFTQTVSLNLSTNLNAGPYYVVVRTDAENNIFENTDEVNNASVSSSSTNITSLPVIDLAVTAGSILSPSVTAGSPVNVQWTVKNNSTYATIVSSWQDAIYLSTNSVLDANDILLSTVSINGSVAAGASYTRTQSVVIPNEAGGTLYLLVTTDKDNVHNDDKRGNNTLPLSGGGGNPTVTIDIPPPADLVPKSLTGPAAGTASQPIDVTFTIRNAGTGPTPASNWIDRLYLSTNLQLAGATQLGAFAHTGTMAAGAEYTVSGKVFLPANVSGNYVLLLETDAGNNVFERNNENNNVAYANIAINPQQPSDLTITRIDLPAGDQYAGASATIGWDLSNIGTNAANGYLREAVYLSPDATLDASDVLFGTLEGTIFLPPQATEKRRLNKPLTNLKIGQYYVFVKTDILDNILEQNETNNQAISVGRIQVNVKQLMLNNLTTDTLNREVPLYYRIEIPASLVGETLSVTIKGDSASGAVNRLFIQRDSIPTANRFGFSATVPFKANQELIVPSLQAGTYYLTGLGNDPTKSKQLISLLAKIIPFSITRVEADQGGNTGLVTVKLSGAKLEPGMTISLVGATVTHQATAVYYTDPAKLYATFNLSGAPLGKYSVKVQKSNGAIAQLPNSFTVIAGTPGGASGAQQLFTCTIQNIGYDENIALDVLAPSSVRRNQKAKITIAYRNAGNVDIPAQTRILLSLEGAPLDFTTEFAEQRKELFLEFVETDGPPGILRAGSSGFINVYTHAIAPISLIITQ